MRTRTILLAVGCLSLPSGIGGCKDVTGPDERLGVARGLWAQAGLSNYTMTMGISCECNIDESGPIVTRVRNGVVESRRYVSSGDLVPSRYNEWFPSVEKLFEIVETGLRDGWTPMETEYHPTTGYPTFVSIPSTAQQHEFRVSLVY